MNSIASSVDNTSAIADFPADGSLKRREGSRKPFRLILLVAGLPLVFLVLELTCKFAIGLGSPPLYQRDAQMEYLLQPSKTYYRFHKRFSVNRYSMRADDFPDHKTAPNELRVMIIGDSIMYGGVRVDQSELASEILKRDLERQLGVPVVVANASAKGWGPPDELAYLKRFGTFDADVVVLELSSHDYQDVPNFLNVVGTTPEFPDKRPRLAIADFLETYLWPWLVQGNLDLTASHRKYSEKDISVCREAERSIFQFAKARQAKVGLVQHLSLEEITGQFKPGYAANRQVAEEESVPHVDDAESLRSMVATGKTPFYSGDSLHLDTLGQEALAHTLLRAVNAALSSGRPSQP
jgi:hypothetical protein